MRKDRSAVVISRDTESVFVYTKGVVRTYKAHKAHVAARFVCRLLWTGEYSISRRDSEAMQCACAAQGRHWTHPEHYIVDTKAAK